MTSPNPDLLAALKDLRELLDGFSDNPDTHRVTISVRAARALLAAGEDAESTHARSESVMTQLRDLAQGLELLSASELAVQGGSWLAAARQWIQWNTRNGDHVCWGSSEELSPPLTVADVENLAAHVAAAAMEPQATTLQCADHLRARWAAEQDRDSLRSALQFYAAGRCRCGLEYQAGERARAALKLTE